MTAVAAARSFAVMRNDSLERSVAKTLEWIKETAAELGSDDEQTAFRVLRAVLHAVRDRIGIEEGAQLAAQLPMVLRGAYYESWVPSHVPETYRDRDEFLRRIIRDAKLSGQTEASYAAAAVVRVLARHVSSGELEDVMRGLPADLRELLEPAVR
jgi:uncharacterized protein (DUF2267 family)